ncbi:MAG TPA: autotransporter outer membrane beta-barrel domain-containing protein, partial [Acidocella sp.]|nr:autotransporter outer membrane beta-barrel domain-containing protein [Acidocella sp.]
TGTAQLGGALVYVLAPGNYTPETGSFLTTSGGFTGSFSSVTTQMQAGQAPASGSATVQAFDPSGSLFFRLGSSFTVAPADAALFADTNQTMAIYAERSSDVLLGHAMDTSAAPCPATGAMQSGGSTQAGIARVLAAAFCSARGWVEASGTRMDVASGYGAQSAGFLAGVDRPVSAVGTRLGLAVGYDEIALTDKAGGTAGTDTVRIGLYGSQPLGRFILSGDVMDGFAAISTMRATGAGDAAGHASGNVVSGGLRITRRLTFAGVSFLPAAGVQAANVSTGAFDETARQTAFVVGTAASGGTSLRPYIKLAISRSFVTASRLVVTPQISLGVDDEAGDPGRAVRMTANGVAFSAAATRLDATAGRIGAGIAASRNNILLLARYTALVSGNWSSQTVEAQLQLKF